MVDISLADGRSAFAASTQISARHASALMAAAKRLDAILKIEEQSLKLSVGGWSALLGRTDVGAETVPELVFTNYRDCVGALQRCRLYYFARPFFLGRVRIRGAIEPLIDILYTINIRNDVPQSTEEKLSLFLFKKLKEWVPLFATRFESGFHYSLDARAYSLFLDRYLQYTCGRFNAGANSIDEAQTEKFELIANWVSGEIGTLKGKRHLDVGCGWGGLVAYFREFYETDSVGLTNCAEQGIYMEHKFKLRPILGDFTCIAGAKEEFDFITVIGMSEHVVGKLKDRLLEIVHEALKPGGMLYFQTIAKPDQWIGGDTYRVAQELIFPGHDLDRRSEAEARFAKSGFEIVHVQDHTADYARTTGEWAKLVSENFDALKAIIGPKNAGLFLMYLLYASKLFKMGRGKLMRYALVKKV
jgi:cyclopropane fatty-acyl-phospholipid synthase-like methyltransferase